MGKLTQKKCRLAIKIANEEWAEGGKVRAERKTRVRQSRAAGTSAASLRSE